MSIRETKHQFQRAADAGIIPENKVMAYTIKAALEAGVQAYHEAYFGDILEEQIANVKGMDHDAKERMLVNTEARIEDMRLHMRAHRETHTTSDFPLALALSRDFVRRPAYLPPDSQLFQFATKRTANDFKKMRAIRTTNFDLLVRKPENTSVEYATFTTTEEGYSISTYALAVAFTYQAYINDDIGEFTAALATLGLAGRRTRAKVLIEAIKGGLDRITLGGSAGGPTMERLVAADEYFGNMMYDGKAQPRILSDIAFPPAWRITAKEALDSPILIVSGGNTQKAISQTNLAYQLATPHNEPMFAEIVPAGHHIKDWLIIDGRQSWLEFATLRGFEGGPKTITRAADVVETDQFGSFDKGTFAVQILDHVGAAVSDKLSAAIVAGG